MLFLCPSQYLKHPWASGYSAHPQRRQPWAEFVKWEEGGIEADGTKEIKFFSLSEQGTMLIIRII